LTPLASFEARKAIVAATSAGVTPEIPFIVVACILPHPAIHVRR
jgi:hypothetical protein